MQSSTEMPFAAIHRADNVAAAPPLPFSPFKGAREHLFQKALTPDVGNLNRLVVPKKHAEKHFLVKRSPLMAGGGMGVVLGFEDGEGKTWRFRYSYCRSSRIYIFTKGWRRYVRDKGLQAGDRVAFYRSAVGPFKKLHIDYLKKREKQDDDATADVVAIGSSHVVVKLFGVDIGRGAKLAIST